MKNHFIQFSAFIFFLLAVFRFSTLLSGQTPSVPGNPSSWSIVASYPIPGKASGLAWDGTYIYFGIYGVSGDQVYKFNPANGNISSQCSGPMDDAYGLTFKSPNLVTIRQPSNPSTPSEAVEFTMAGAQVSALTLPNHYMSGIAYDNGTYWVCTYYPEPGTVYHLNASGGIISQFIPPNNQPWDICTQGSDLWIADYWGDMLYKVSSTGTLLESHPSQGTDPSGIVFDGTYLWYCDGGSSSTLYKVNLSGTGTPVINVPTTTYNYGTVTIGNAPTWNCVVQNTGTANLVINSVGIPSGQYITTTFVPPANIAPGGSFNIPLTYTPLTAGHLNTQVTINSNDPIHPQKQVSLSGDAVNPGPHISVGDTLHDWEARRAGAYSRWYLQVTNNGDQPLTITALNCTDNHFSIDEEVQLPLSIGSLETSDIGIWFHPEDGVSYSGSLEITSNDLTQNPFTVDLMGEGIDTLYPVGSLLWIYHINGGFDNSPKSIIPIDDITGDGVDEVIIGSEDNYIRCLNGNSSGEADLMWAVSIYSGSVYQQNSMAATGDINGDGYKDIIVGTAWGDRSINALSGKTGLQLWKHDTHEYGDGGWVYQVDSKYDYNNDSFPDVLASTGDDSDDTGPKRVYCLDGKTGTSIWERPCEGAVFAVMGVEDFNGDGKPDAVAGSTTASETHAKVYGINGANGAQVWVYSPGGSSTWGLMQIDDITGDGVPDIASGDFSGNIYLHNAVNGARVTSVSLPASLIIRFEDMGDVNKDGYRDILVAHSGTTGQILSGLDLTSIWSTPLSDKSWNVANIGDITWDGVNDAGIGTLYSNNMVYFLNGNTGNIVESVPTANAIDALSGIPDIVGDLTMELVAGGREGTVGCLSGGYDSSTISVPERKNLLSGQYRIFPNPCHNRFSLLTNLTEPSELNISITDMTGRVLLTGKKYYVLAGEQVVQMDRSSLGLPEYMQGVYILSVESGDGRDHFRIIFY